MWGWLCWWRPPCLLRRVIVNFTHDSTEAFEGVLWSTRGPWLTLKDCEGLRSGEVVAKLKGDVVVHRQQIAFLQVLP